MEKMKEVWGQLKALANLNYSLIFDKCFECHESKNGRMLFCSIRCAIKTVRG